MMLTVRGVCPGRAGGAPAGHCFTQKAPNILNRILSQHDALLSALRRCETEHAGHSSPVSTFAGVAGMISRTNGSTFRIQADTVQNDATSPAM